MTVLTVAQAVRRTGARHWLASFRAMLRFEATNLREFLIVALVIQVLMGGGMAVMYGFYFGNMSPVARTFLVSGIPALALIPIGFVLIPAVIGDHRLEETYDFIWSLPVPRLSSAAATFTIFTALAVPGTLASLAISVLVYDVTLQPSLAIVPAVLVSAAMASIVGYTMGHAVSDPRVTNLFTNLIIFVVLMFSPIVVPIEVFPAWFAGLHRVLPFWHIANMIRAGLTDGLVEGVGWSYVVAGVWTAVAAWIATRIITRRS